MLTEDATLSRSFAAVSHLGHVRLHNQDSYFIAAAKGLALVADGVGGQGDGAWASKRAVELFVRAADVFIPALGAKSAADQKLVITEVLSSVHTQMFAETRAESDKPSGTTIAGIWAPKGSKGPATVFNVGDSSVFHLSAGKIAKVSHDHSLYQLWLDGGRIGREPAKRTIMQALGISDQLAPFIAPLTLQPGDAVLICTDGLSGTMPPSRMAHIVAGAQTSQRACEALLDEALAGPAPDNVTATVCFF